MWLLDVVTRKLVFFNSESDVPGGYAILSHTWGDNEVTFHEIENWKTRGKQAYHKVAHTCSKAKAHGLRYAWIDTCKLGEVQYDATVAMGGRRADLQH